MSKELDIDPYRIDETGEESYDPIANAGLAHIVTGTHHAAQENLRVLPYKGDVHKVGNRVLHIIYDTVIGIAASEDDPIIESRINGDAVFVLNALLARREEVQSMREITDFGSGFRGKSTQHEEDMKNISTYFGRSIHALNAIAKDSTGAILIGRTSWGQGVQKGRVPALYKIKNDITVTDTRAPRQS